MIITEYSPMAGVSEKKSRTIALGFFDGVHLAHRQLLMRTVKIARNEGNVPAVFTFSAGSMGRKKRGGLIYSTEDKLKIMKGIGIEEVFVADFTTLSHLSPEEFVTRVLCEDLGCSVAVSGYNFRFGKGASGDASDLVSYMRALGGDGVVCDPVCLEGSPVSSSTIRAELRDGRVDVAARMLGEPYFITGKVSRGIGKGHSLGFPTVNTDLPDGCPLGRGVYRGYTVIDGVGYNTLTNIGICPTLGERSEHAETFIINFSDDIYGKDIKIHLLGFIREEKQFASAEELAEQIKKDIHKATEENGEETWQEIGLN